MRGRTEGYGAATAPARRLAGGRLRQSWSWPATAHLGGTMKHLRRIVAALATLAGAVLATATAASATLMPPDEGGGGSGGGGVQPSAQVVTQGGMAGWQITLIALAAGLAAAAVAVLLDRAWVARKAAHAPAA